MQCAIQPATFDELRPWRDLYRQEMHCQIVCDSFHTRLGWTSEHWLLLDELRLGYGSVVHAGPWQGAPTLYEFFVLPDWRTRAIDLFENLLASTGVKKIHAQSNDPLLSLMLFVFAVEVTSEAILFEDRMTTFLENPGADFRAATEEDVARSTSGCEVASGQWLLEAKGNIAAAGGILFHYNRPFGDIYMHVAEPFRRRGFGAYLVQELKRVCYQEGSVPAARCNTGNVASRKTLQKAGFVPCGHRLSGRVA